MKTINANTKKGQQFIHSFERSRKTSIYQRHNNPSTAKTRAEYFCMSEMFKEGGNDFRILGYNTMQFTCGWRTAEGLRVETASNSYLIK